MRILSILIFVICLIIHCWADEITLLNPAPVYQFPTVTFQYKTLIQGEVKANVGIKSVMAHIANAKQEKEALTCQIYYLDGTNKQQVMFKTSAELRSPNSILTIEVIHDDKSTYQKIFFIPMGCATSRYGDFSEITSAQVHKDHIRSVYFSKDNRYLVTACDDYTVKLLDAYTLKTIKTFSGHLASARQAIITSDNRTIISCSTDKSIKIWDVASGKCVHTFYDREFPVLAIALSPDEKYLASSSRYILMWNLPERKFISKWKLSYFMDMTPLTFSADGKKLCSGDDRGSVKLWKASDGYYEQSEYHSAPITGITICPSNRYMFSADSKGYIKWWLLLIDPNNSSWSDDDKMWEQRMSFVKGTEPADIEDYKSFFSKVKYFPVYIVTDTDGSADSPYSSFTQGGAIVGLQLNSTGEFLMFASRDGEIRIHETATSKECWSKILNTVLSCATFSSNGSLVAVAGSNGKIWIYGIEP